MRLLLDTQAIVLASQDRLPRNTRSILADHSNALYFSLVSFWEIGIKAARGTLLLRMPLVELVALVSSELTAEEVPLHIEAIQTATNLPFHNKDPFDRLLAAQAIVSGHTIVSSDLVFDSYGCRRLW